jgi:lipoprotein-releasing system permease protein
MFEFKIAFKYLLFKKRRLSSSLISLLSILVISIVVWLVLVFLSVTNGIEKNWLNKLTALNAPIRLTPTSEYYSSYYYLIDSVSSNSNYTYKNIKEKLESPFSDPYDTQVDMELPYSFPKPIYIENKFLDPIKTLFSILDNQKKKNSNTSFQDYEISAALIRLNLNRQNKDLFTEFKEEKLSFLTQMTYLFSLSENNPNLKSLMLQPSAADLNHIIYKLGKSFDSIQKDIPNYPKNIDEQSFCIGLKNLFFNINVEKVELEKGFPIDLNLIKIKAPIKASAKIENDNLITLIVTNEIENYLDLIPGEIYQENNLYFFQANNKKYKVLNTTDIHLGDNLVLFANINPAIIKNAKSYDDFKIQIHGTFQNNTIEGTIPFKNVKLNKVSLDNTKENPFFYSYFKNKIILPSTEEKTGIIIPKNYQNNGILVGDNGYLSYCTMTINSNQEMRIPIFVAGFYDPGVLPIGNRCIIVPSDITKTINATSNNLTYDNTPTNGIYVWIKDIKKANQIANDLKKELEKAHISSFFEITTYKDFEFSKDLMQQFQSDKTLFTLIAIIILIAACSNIISMLVLLVNDKKKEIAILRSMGASSKSIALIFGFCGFFMGIASSVIGISSAVLTLRHLDSVINFLSVIQGHNFFNAAFFGNKLPSDLSLDSLIFVLILTPILAILAGLIPAIKASKIQPSTILRSE